MCLNNNKFVIFFPLSKRTEKSYRFDWYILNDYNKTRIKIAGDKITAYFNKKLVNISITCNHPHIGNITSKYSTCTILKRLKYQF